MKLIKKQHLAVAIILSLLVLMFTGCKPTFKYSGIEELSYVVQTEEDLAHLDEYPDVKKLNLSGSTLDQAQLGEWIAIHPWIEIIYTIPIGDQLVSCEATELTVPEGQSGYDELLQNLKYLPALEVLSLENTALTAEQITALEKEYRDLDIRYTMTLAGESVDGRVTSLDLSRLTSADVGAAAQQLPGFAALTDVTLTGSGLTPADVAQLVAAAPGINFQYSFELFGKTVSTTDTALEYQDTDIGNSGIDALRQALDIMPGCTYVKLENCGVDSDTLAELKQEYPNIVIAWRVPFGSRSLLTDMEALQIGADITDADTQVLQHFTQMKYLEVNNPKLTDFSFLASMPNLEAATLSKTLIDDLSPLSGCTKLEWLEIAECKLLDDLSVVKNLTSLRYLNISKTGITDLTPLKGLPLEYLMCLNSKVSTEQRMAVEADHPNALVRFGGGYNYGYGWWYMDYNKNPTEYYKKLCKIFGK